jgi:hypothetical protein
MSLQSIIEDCKPQTAKPKFLYFTEIKSFLVLILIGAAIPLDNSYWKDAWGRGVGKLIHTCGEGLGKDGWLCYPHAKLATIVSGQPAGAQQVNSTEEDQAVQ